MFQELFNFNCLNLTCPECKCAKKSICPQIILTFSGCRAVLSVYGITIDHFNVICSLNRSIMILPPCISSAS